MHGAYAGEREGVSPPRTLQSVPRGANALPLASFLLCPAPAWRSLTHGVVSCIITWSRGAADEIPDLAGHGVLLLPGGRRRRAGAAGRGVALLEARRPAQGARRDAGHRRRPAGRRGRRRGAHDGGGLRPDPAP